MSTYADVEHVVYRIHDADYPANGIVFVCERHGDVLDIHHLTCYTNQGTRTFLPIGTLSKNVLKWLDAEDRADRLEAENAWLRKEYQHANLAIAAERECNIGLSLLNDMGRRERDGLYEIAKAMYYTLRDHVRADDGAAEHFQRTMRWVETRMRELGVLDAEPDKAEQEDKCD